MASKLPENANQVFKGSIFTVYQWPQKMFDGSTQTFECLVRPNTTGIIPFLDRETVLMLKQEQPGREPFWDVPGGMADEGETLEQAALRELYEETGYRANSYAQWDVKQFQGKMRFEVGFFVAKDLHLDPNHVNHEAAGEKIELVPMKWDDVIQLCLEQKLRHSDLMMTFLTMHYHPPTRARLDQFLND